MTQCAHCHKRTTRSPERYTLIRQSAPVYGCTARLYGVLCAACYRKQRAVFKRLSAIQENSIYEHSENQGYQS